MSLTVTTVSREDIGLGERIVADVTFDSSYLDGGEPILASDFGFRVGAVLSAVNAGPGAPGAAGVIGRYVPDGSLLDRGLLQAIVVATGLQVAGAVDLAAVVMRVVAYGR